VAGRQRGQQDGPYWNFKSFPAFVGLVSGLFIATTLISIEAGGISGTIHSLLWFVSLIGVSFSAVHAFNGYRYRKRVERQREREEEEAAERRVLAARAAAAEDGHPARQRRRRRH
jgi:hypothetical protein